MNAEPVLLEQVAECQYKQKPCGLCGKSKGHVSHRKRDGTCPYKRQIGCDKCGRPKGDPVHFGAPPSLNILASGDGGGNGHVYVGLKKNWQAILIRLLEDSGLPRGLERVYVEGEATFPDHRTERDQGNFRVLIEKALGDALQEGGWLASDNWDHYEFGGFQKKEVPGVSATRLMVFPMPAHKDENEQLELS